MKGDDMPIWKRGLLAAAAVVLAAVGLGSFVVALVVIAWPATNYPQGKAGNWLIATPYLVAAVILFAVGASVIWFGFRRTNSTRNRKADS